MSDETSNSDNVDHGGEDWVSEITSTGDLAEAGRPIEPEDLDINLSNLDDEEIEFLDSQTIRILDRHVEIQENQHQQARNTLRGMIIITAGVAASIPFINSFIQSIEFSSNTPPQYASAGFLFLILASILAQQIAFDILTIIDSSFDILSPESTERGSIGRLLALFNLLKPASADEEEGGTIRSVSIFDELAAVIDDPQEGLRPGVLINRLNRIRRDERVINRNMVYLFDTSQRAKYAIERGIAIIVFISASLILLGAQI
jgi:hypothetical protein